MIEIIVRGMPGIGKTTLAHVITAALLPLFKAGGTTPTIVIADDPGHQEAIEKVGISESLKFIADFLYTREQVVLIRTTAIHNDHENDHARIKRVTIGKELTHYAGTRQMPVTSAPPEVGHPPITAKGSTTGRWHSSQPNLTVVNHPKPAENVQESGTDWHEVDYPPGSTEGQSLRSSSEHPVASNESKSISDVYGRMLRSFLETNPGPNHGETPEQTIARQKKWINELLAGNTVNCIFCGHCYGPSATTAVSQQDVLKAHVMQCPEHPLAVLRRKIVQIYDTWLLVEDDQAEAAVNSMNEIRTLLHREASSG
jgi:hypothetical protein